MMRYGGVLLALALVGCEQTIGATGPSGTERPSIVSACSERPTGLASEPKHPPDRDRPIIVNVTQPAPVVNVPDRPTINCTRGGGASEAD